MNIKPYIGITDFTSFEQVTQMLKVFRGHKPFGSQRVLHVGVMMSFKTLNGIDTVFLDAFPPKDTIAGIFCQHHDDDVYHCLHYADYANLTRSADLVRALGYAGPYVHAIQLDMAWPDPEMIASAVRESKKQVEVILQIGKSSIEECGGDPTKVVRRLETYEGVIHRVLLDQSMGRGLGMDAQGLIPFVQAIKDRFPKLGIVVAGGLGPDTIGLVEPIAKAFPDISIDAQGKLRPSGSALDPIDWDVAGTYLVKALELLK